MKQKILVGLVLLVASALLWITYSTRLPEEAVTGSQLSTKDVETGDARAGLARADLIGDWVEPVPGMEGEVQGFSLHADGSAASINMATLRYQRWRFDEGELRLTGESVGNRTSGEFEDRYRVQLEGAGRLRLIDAEGRAWRYVKR